MRDDVAGPDGSGLSEGLAGCDEDAHECSACHGKGWNDEWKAVRGHYMGGEVFRVQCDACEGGGK